MSYTVVLRATARKDLAALPEEVGRRIVERLADLGRDPGGPNTKTLHGKLAGRRRLRVGN